MLCPLPTRHVLSTAKWMEFSTPTLLPRLQTSGHVPKGLKVYLFIPNWHAEWHYVSYLSPFTRDVLSQPSHYNHSHVYPHDDLRCGCTYSRSAILGHLCRLCEEPSESLDHLWNVLSPAPSSFESFIQAHEPGEARS